jgi:hypothetical protein
LTLHPCRRSSVSPSRANRDPTRALVPLRPGGGFLPWVRRASRRRARGRRRAARPRPRGVGRAKALRTGADDPELARGGVAVVGSGGHCCVSALAYRLLPRARTDPRPQLASARGVFQHSTTSLRTARAHAGIVCTRRCDGPGLDASRRRFRHPVWRNLEGGPRARKRSADAADNAG